MRLEATAAQPITTAPTECVLDLDRFGEVIGIEIVNLEHNTGQKAPGSNGLATLDSGERVGWSYDQEADAFYISIKDERSFGQRNGRCFVGGTANGQLVIVTVDCRQE